MLCKLSTGVGGVVCSAMRVQKMIVEKRRNAKFAALKDLAVRSESSCAPFQVPCRGAVPCLTDLGVDVAAGLEVGGGADLASPDPRTDASRQR